MKDAFMRGVVALALLAAAGCEARATPPQGQNQMVVVELFESQGCSSCPPANANVNALSGRTDVLSLIYGVTYWDQLGWTDMFARPEFTTRQRDYQHGLGNDNVYTPQIVLNGREDLVGNDRAALDHAIRHARSTHFAASVRIGSANVDVSGNAQGRQAADVWLVRYDPRTLNVPIRAGENAGRTLPHTHVVKQLERLGTWNGGDHSYALPPTSQRGLRTAVLVQEPGGGPIIGAAGAAE